MLYIVLIEKDKRLLKARKQVGVNRVLENTREESDGDRVMFYSGCYLEYDVCVKVVFELWGNDDICGGHLPEALFAEPSAEKDKKKAVGPCSCAACYVRHFLQVGPVSSTVGPV